MISYLKEFFSHCFIIQAVGNRDCDYAVTLVVVVLFLAFMKFLTWVFRYPYVDNLEERCVLVTGCDSGFGEKLCVELDRKGCQVFACCLTNKGIEHLRCVCSSNVKTFLLDVRDETNVIRVLNEVKDELKGRRLWGLVNNAGVCGTIGPIEFLKVKDFQESLEINFIGPVKMVEHARPLMEADSSEKARIINVSSILGTFHTPYSSPYCIAKGALNTWSHILSYEPSKSNTKVIIVEPGAHETNFIASIDSSIQSCWNRLSEEARIRYGKNNLKKIILLGSIFLKIFTRKRLDGVIDAICHALLSRRPCSRYVIGIDAQLMDMASYLPRKILLLLYKVGFLVISLIIKLKLF